MKKYKIYQIKKENQREFGFEGWEYIKNQFQMARYNMIYEGMIAPKEDTHEVLEALFTQFNQNHPADFKGHSLSVSDIVLIDGKYFYCDSYSWQDITNIVLKEMKGAE